ncbi:MAG TPA: GNAT family N-acetyltransferase [Burkholderiaceae bacterium]|jgi:GNAT superfamily N-acetyltransferase
MTSSSPSKPEAPQPLGRLRRAVSDWVPIRPLTHRHRRRITHHLLALDERDRYLRFGYAANDAQIERYAAGLDFERDEILGIFNRRLELVAMAHLAYDPSPQRAGQPAMAEFGVSVGAKARGRGIGRRLFEHAALHARNRGIDTLFIHALSENAPMLKIARNAGAKVERDGSESEAWLRLSPDTMSSHVDEAVERHLAEVDFQLKRHLREVRRIGDKLRWLKHRVFGPGKTAKP